jgi:hypothetical protein
MAKWITEAPAVELVDDSDEATPVQQNGNQYSVLHINLQSHVSTKSEKRHFRGF